MEMYRLSERFNRACEQDQYYEVVTLSVEEGLTTRMMIQGANIAYYYNNQEIFEYLLLMTGMLLEDYINRIPQLVTVNDEFKENDYTIMRWNHFDTTVWFHIGPLVAEVQGYDLDLSVRKINQYYIFYTKTHELDPRDDRNVSRDQLGVVFAGEVIHNDVIMNEGLEDLILEQILTLWSNGHTEFVMNSLQDTNNALEGSEFPMLSKEMQYRLWYHLDQHEDDESKM
jgi:hypothetical protein